MVHDDYNAIVTISIYHSNVSGISIECEVVRDWRREIESNMYALMKYLLVNFANLKGTNVSREESKQI